MKKFLFTLAALLMASNLYADQMFFIDDFEVSQELLQNENARQRRMKVNVKAHFDYLVSGWQVNLTLPEGVEIKNCEALEGMTIQGLDAEGYPKAFPVALSNNLTAGTFIGASTEAGYYYPEGQGPDTDDPTPIGANKWVPGDYVMFSVTLEFSQDFQGGEIGVEASYACGDDPRADLICPKNLTSEATCTVTVEGGSEPEKTEAPVITYDDETFTVSATGAGTVKLYVNGEEVSNPYTFELGEEETIYTVTATAQEEGKEISETATLEVTVPAAPVVVEVTPKPIIDVLTDQESETVTVRATGDGHICIYWDDQLMAEGEGVAEWVIPFGEDPEGEEYGVSATAQEEGKEVSEYALATVFVPGKAEPQPYETPAPAVTTEETDEAIVITATGEGTVTLYVQIIDNETGEMTTETYEGEGTVSAVVPRGEETYYINYWAVAQANEDAEPGSTQVSYFVEVPAKEIIPVDPSHEQGVWIVTFLAGGEEFWQEMLPSNEDYTCIVRFSYGNYGTFPYDPNKSMAENDAMRPDMPFYIVIDGVRYGAAEDGTLCVLGTALSNELYENENLYVLEHALGRVYNMGVAIDELDPSKKYVYAAVAAYTEVEEMNASKTVAGVRYFNMAGQEMQEANGMTIVVTTYTDGTTSAVKVMK